ncbi:MAG: hypothetical protein QOG85_10 [Gaiellaceae bacterium]|jgi:hypothetical protein|nr:hypothetical protein [Gaiellaceae bacterium]
MRKEETFKLVELTLASGTKGFHNGRACFRSDGKVVPATSAPGLHPIGVFKTNPKECIDATSADKTVTVDLETEKQGEWWANATAADAVTASDVGKVVYMLDDQTVTITPTGRSSAGRAWRISATKGVLVEKLNTARAVLSQPTLPAFAAGDSAPTGIEHEAVYDVPTTAANSTITLPAAAADGTRAHFHADGTKNGHTITYRDATGTVLLNTATTASKRHLATAIKNAGKWAVNVTVAP